MSFYEKGMRIKKDDILLIKFGPQGDDRPSLFKVLKANSRKMFLQCKVLSDYYVPSVGATDKPYIPNEIVDIGKMIYDVYWGFEKVYIKKLETK